MTLRRWALVAAVAFMVLALRAEVREILLANSTSHVFGSESFRPGIVQLGAMVLIMTSGLALLVRWLKSGQGTERDSRIASRIARRKNSGSQPSFSDKAGHSSL